MKQNYRVGVIVVAVFLLSACAPKTRTPTIDADQARAEALRQMETAITERVKLSARLSRVAFPVLSVNANDCGDDARWYAGFHSAPEKINNDIAKIAWGKLYGVDGKLTVRAVPAGTPADRAGLQVRDKIILVNGEKEGTLTTLIDRVKSWSKGDSGKLKLRIQRGVKHLDLTIDGVKACYSSIQIKESEDVNAFADGDKIYITTGMLKFVDSDDELALVIAHEMAHNTMGHSLSKLGNRVMGALVDATVLVLTGVNTSNLAADLGSMAYSQEYEAEADYVGSYYAAKAGYDDVKGAAALWRRMATAHPNAINLQGSTHPSTATRFLAIEKAVEEIEQKKANGRPLEPEMK